MEAKITKSTKECSTLYYKVEMSVNNKQIIIDATIERDNRGDSLSDYKTHHDSHTEWNSLSSAEKEAIRKELADHFQN